MKKSRTKKRKAKFFLSLVLFVTPSIAWSFPEMIRHGYSNCTTCHLSPSGGGVLSEYGRELSKEVAATWKNDSEKSKEHQFGYGMLTLAQWLKMGGDVRSVYVYQDDQYRTNGKTILMQADLEGAGSFGRFTAEGTVGYRDSRESKKFLDSTQSRRHYLMYAFNDTWTIRGGRFLAAYGINTADHVSVTKRILGIGQGYESYNLEASYIAERFNLFFTGNLGRPDDTSLMRDFGLITQISYLLGHTYKIGFNFYSGQNPRRSRTLYGVFGILGLSEKIALLSELDLQNAKSSGLAMTQKLSYEAYPGILAFLNQEWLKLDFGNNLSRTEVYGLGVQLFPRVHFEFNLAWNWKKDYSYSKEFYSYAWLMSHFYF